MQEASSIDNTAMSLEKEEITKEEESMKEKEKTLPKKLLKFSRFFTNEDIHPFDEIEWLTTRVIIKNLDNNVIFDHEVEHPVQWNEMAVRTCADKYFKTHNLENHNQGGERSVRDVIHRVAYSVSHRGIQMEYFDEENGKIIYDELCYLMINQMGAFNSPVFFNWGLYDVYNFKGNSKAKRWAIKDRDKEVFDQEFEYENPQGSACKSGDTWIYTDKGPMHLKDLVEKFNNGEEDIKVMSSHGYCDIIAAKYNGIKPTYKVTLEGKNKLRITEDDEIFTKTEEGTENFRTVKEICMLVESLIDVKVKTKQIDGNSFWYLIKSVKYHGEEKVYDIETENHDFYANGILVHNCFITEVNDELVNGENGIYDWIQTEMSIFANGSGSGLNVSKIRGKDEPITGGGKSSGLISFLEVADASAGVIKSGGKCLAPDQFVYTENGPIKAKELEDKEFICLSYDPPSSRFKAKKANCWKSGQKNIIEIITDKGKFTVSEDHPIKLSCGKTLVANELEIGQSVFNCKVDESSGYLRVSLKDGKKGRKHLHTLIAEDVLNWNTKNKIVHHVNENKFDNNIDNLKLISSQSEHARLHNEKIVKENKHPFQTNIFDTSGSKNGMHLSSKFHKNKEKVNQWKNKLREKISTVQSRSMQKLSIRKKMINTAYKIINNGCNIDTFENYITSRINNIGRIASKDYVFNSIKNNFGSYENFLKEINNNNHRVIEINKLGTSDVYSIEVQCPTLDDKSENSGHNFVIWPDDNPVGSGIVVFNTRRAAKMIILDDNHPDLIDFIDWKKDEEFKARALMLMGYPQNWSDEKGAYKSVQAQNANNSIALTDDFMQAVINDDNWELKNVTDGKTREIIKARDILEKIVEANWECGDPGVFFIDTINSWHTIPNTGPIEASNPCLAGDTLVATADGRNAVSIKQLAEEEKDVPVYSWNQDNQSMEIKWGRHPRLTGKNKKLLKITLDDGGQIRTTEDHKFILKDGSKIEAKDLELNMSLMSFNKNTLDELDVFEIPGYENVELSGNYNIVITKKCENCGSLFKRVYKDREAAYCSLVCSETAASSAGKKDRLETSSNEESKELSSSHKVVSIEEDRYEDVYNITVDDNHNVALISSVNKNNTKFSGICVLNCGEYLNLNNTSCNLASLNLVRFLNKDKTFNINAFKASIEYFITAMEIIVGGSSYPSKKIAEMTRDTRALGIGYCNMGGLIMILGYPYDSDQARSIISTITSLETATAYAQSAKIASVVGPFNEYSNNKQEFISIIKKHAEANSELKPRIKFTKQVHQAAIDTWSEATSLIQRHGARNSQVVVIAPTGTIMFLMGTTNNGIEPSYSLCSYKLMSDGSVVELLCEEAKTALLDLGYNKHQVDDISKYILQHGIAEGAPHLNVQHYPIFDTANVDGNGKRYIGMMAHVEAIAAATPFISGGISKTTNLPENATREDIRNCYIEAWKKGCKGLALYRSGSKWSQPLNSKNNKFKKETIKREIQRTKKRLSDSDFHKTSSGDFWEFYRGLITRKKAENRAQSERFNFNIGSENVWMNIVRFPNNGISEVWLEVGKENPTVNGLADTIGRICSIAIQYGVPIEAICSTMEGLQFSPAGFLRKNDLGVRSAKSLSDLTSQVLTKLNAEYNGLDFEDISPVWNNDIELGEEPISVSEIEQAKAKGFSGTRCEKCGSWRTKGTIKCGVCLSCQTTYGTCGG